MKKLGKKIITLICVVGLGIGISTFTEVTKAKDDAYMKKTDHQFMYAKDETSNMIASGAGKYYMIKDYNLYVADKDDMKFEILCYEPDCKHNMSETQEEKMECKGSFLTSTFLAYYDGNLYTTLRDYSKGGEKLDLVKMSLDGKKKESIFTFDKTPESIVIHRGELYYSMRDNIDSDDAMYRTRYILNRVKLGDEKVTKLYKGDLDREEVIENIICYGKYIYFTVRSYKDDEITSKQMYYDTVTNTIERIHSDDDRDIVRGVEIAEDKIIYSVCNIISEDDFTYKEYMANLDGSEVEESFTEKAHGYALGDGKNFFVQITDKIDYKQIGIQVRTPEGDLISSVDTKDYFKDGYRVLAGDEDYLFIVNRPHKDRSNVVAVDKKKLMQGEFEQKLLVK